MKPYLKIKHKMGKEGLEIELGEEDGFNPWYLVPLFTPAPKVEELEIQT